jgi:RNA polymerase sigma-70 factor (ECF subfamily)
VWVYTVATNVLRNASRGLARSEARESTWLAERDDTADPRSAVERRVLLAEAMAQLSDEDRNVLGLRFWEGLTAREIGSVLGVPTREVYTRVDRCLRALERHLSLEQDLGDDNH